MLLESALAFCTNINSTLFDQVAAEFSLTEISRVSKAFLSQVGAMVMSELIAGE